MTPSAARRGTARLMRIFLCPGGWIAGLIRERLGLPPATGRPGKALLEMLGDEKAGGTELEIPPLPGKTRPAALED